MQLPCLRHIPMASKYLYQVCFVKQMHWIAMWLSNSPVYALFVLFRSMFRTQVFKCHQNAGPIDAGIFFNFCFRYLYVSYQDGRMQAADVSSGRMRGNITSFQNKIFCGLECILEKVKIPANARHWFGSSDQSQKKLGVFQGIMILVWIKTKLEQQVVLTVRIETPLGR